MNKIVFVGELEAAGGEKTDKYFKIAVPDDDGGEIVLVPPNVKYTFAFKSATLILLEQALLPVKEVTLIPDDNLGSIRSAASSAREYFGKSQIVLSALGNLLAAYVTAFTARDKFSPVVAIVREDIIKNVSNPTYYLDDALKKLPLNYDYVRKLFKKETGATPHEFLLQQRMELAANLLHSGITNRYSGYTVSQIAEACGFSEPLYFSRVFKKYYGMAPSEYQSK
ncbi:MAG: helix-turn-helix transcriptional regulator [Clostridia bacterium]|nr:helix-turn-helix transcriptional regulator [Clostridia bacterium]